jgi:hypothetical protein
VPQHTLIQSALAIMGKPSGLGFDQYFDAGINGASLDVADGLGVRRNQSSDFDAV